MDLACGLKKQLDGTNSDLLKMSIFYYYATITFPSRLVRETSVQVMPKYIYAREVCKNRCSTLSFGLTMFLVFHLTT